MSHDCIDRTRGRRRALGLAPCSGGYGGGASDRQGWARRMIRDGRPDELPALADRQAEEDERRRREQTPTFDDIPPEELGAQIDADLLDWTGPRSGRWSKEETDVLGILGVFLGRNACETVFESLLLRELRRLDPAEDEDTLRGRMDFAKSCWIDVYRG